jgi:hypothetical protein
MSEQPPIDPTAGQAPPPTGGTPPGDTTATQTVAPPTQTAPPPPGTPGLPGAPTPPPGGAAGGFKLSRGAVIGIVGAGVGILATLGVVAAASADGPAPVSTDPTAPVTEVAAPDDVLQPTPVATVPAPPPVPQPPPTENSTPAPVPTPVPAPPQPDPQPQPEPDPQPAPTGTVEIARGDVRVSIPLSGSWQGRTSSDGSGAMFGDGNNNFAWFGLYAADPATDAASLIAQHGAALIGAENFTGLETGEILPMQPAGGIVSLAQVVYQGTWTDPQSSFPLRGVLFVGVRQDGAVLAATAETSPPENFDGKAQMPLILGAFNHFAGVS